MYVWQRFLQSLASRSLARHSGNKLQTSSACLHRDIMGTRVTSGWSPPAIQHLLRQGDNTIAYRQTVGKQPGVMFLPGFMSNMNGGKALELERYCQNAGLAYTRFDYQGLGDSNGYLAPGVRAFDVWKADALAVLDQLTSGPQILVGSSMGGAVMLLLALERPQRIQALIGIATAVNFSKSLNYTEAKPQAVADSPAEEMSYVTPKDFVDKRYQRRLMDDSVEVTCPIRLLHGMRDETVPYTTSLDLAQRLASGDVDVVLRKDGDHRMSHEGDLRLLTQTLQSLILGGHSETTVPLSQLGQTKL